MAKPKKVTPHFYAGWDSFTPDPGKQAEMHCRVCGQDMKVDRNTEIATCFVEAMANKTHLVDHFFCPDSGTDWHDKALAILKVAQDSPSEVMKYFMLQEARHLVINKCVYELEYVL